MSLKAKLATLARRIANAGVADKYLVGGVCASIERLTELFLQAAGSGVVPPELAAVLDADGGRCRRWMNAAVPGIVAAVEREQLPVQREVRDA